MNAKRIWGTIRYWVWASWPALPMSIATVVGLALGFAVVIYVIQPTTELGVNFAAAAIMFVVQSLTFAWVMRAGRVAEARAQADRYRELVERLKERDPDEDG